MSFYYDYMYICMHECTGRTPQDEQVSSQHEAIRQTQKKPELRKSFDNLAAHALREKSDGIRKELYEINTSHDG